MSTASPPSPMSSDEDISLSLLASSDEIAESSDIDDISLPPAEPYEWLSDGTTPKKRLRLGRVRTWLTADELVLLEAVAAHKEQHGLLPSPAVLVAALRGRLVVDAKQVANRLSTLRSRLGFTTKMLSGGRIPVKDDDLKILSLSRRIWGTGRNRWRSRGRERHERREFAELARRYPSLAAEVEAIEARNGSNGMLRMAFEFIGDVEATELDAKIKEQHLFEFKVNMKGSDLTMTVARELLNYLDS